MCSYNANNGIAACGDDFFQNTLYREHFGFDGYIVSDCDSVGDPAFEMYIERRYPELNSSAKWMAEAREHFSNFDIDDHNIDIQYSFIIFIII